MTYFWGMLIYSFILLLFDQVRSLLNKWLEYLLIVLDNLGIATALAVSTKAAAAPPILH